MLRRKKKQVQIVEPLWRPGPLPEHIARELHAQLEPAQQAAVLPDVAMWDWSDVYSDRDHCSVALTFKNSNDTAWTEIARAELEGCLEVWPEERRRMLQTEVQEILRHG